MKKLFFLLLAGSAIFFNSCTKTGPMGPQGQTGAQGPQGNANVIGSDAFSVSSWTLTNSVYSASFTDADITSDVDAHGVVEVFKLYSDGTWTNLPDINGKTSTVFNFSTGAFDIYIQNSDGTVPANPGTQTFRVVVIAPSQRQAHPNTNWKNYNEAMAAINADKASSATVTQ